MLKKENFTEEHIRNLQSASHRDPLLLERSVYAFGLLEAITRVGMPFIFKGGTCLMLLLERPMRLSTDIDIIVAPGTDLNTFIEEAGKIFPFVSVEEQVRKGKNNIEKRHFKFVYESPVMERSIYILLDVLFEDAKYKRLITKPIKNELILTDGEDLTVQIPSVESILGDKLTAFAPHTTGILLNSNKDMFFIDLRFIHCAVLIKATGKPVGSLIVQCPRQSQKVVAVDGSHAAVYCDRIIQFCKLGLFRFVHQSCGVGMSEYLCELCVAYFCISVILPQFFLVQPLYFR